jgi:hypothetical protein
MVMQEINVLHSDQINVDSTPSNQELIQHEKTFSSQLLKIANESTGKDTFQSDGMVYEGTSKAIRSIIRPTINKFYTIGALYANEVNNSEFFPTQTDVDNVSAISSEIGDLFFKNLRAYLVREEQIGQALLLKESLSRLSKAFPASNGKGNLSVAYDHAKSLQLDKGINRLAVVASTRSVNHGTASKIRQLLSLPNAKLVYDYSSIKVRYAVKQIEKRTFKRFSESRLGNFVVWVTAQDDKVCFKYCRPLEGRIFNLADENTPIPPDDTHPHCRCRLFNIDRYTGNVLYG